MTWEGSKADDKTHMMLEILKSFLDRGEEGSEWGAKNKAELYIKMFSASVQWSESDNNQDSIEFPLPERSFNILRDSTQHLQSSPTNNPKSNSNNTKIHFKLISSIFISVSTPFHHQKIYFFICHEFNFFYASKKCNGFFMLWFKVIKYLWQGIIFLF